LVIGLGEAQQAAEPVFDAVNAERQEQAPQISGAGQDDGNSSSPQQEHQTYSGGQAIG
jgi:hypothetical protein